ncbi:MAG: alpha/beta fold hydrolase [Methylococcaceae bacterium]|nr:alpha/beta fold hydrolase [Methylococcaceae bacterium]
MFKKTLFGVFCLLSLIACTPPAKHFAEIADSYGFNGFSINSEQFEHQFYVNQAVMQPSADQKLHVYLDGDGTPWEQQRWVADDPTSRNPMILAMMQQDKAAAVFLGRPCYHGLNHTSACHLKYWTSHRYSAEVVRSMVAALKKCLIKYPFKQLVLIGYSGGGTLAALIAPYFPEVKTLVTVAANLDVAAWSRHHGYQALNESLNPAVLPLNPQLRQIHLAGLEDTVVPAWIIKTYAQGQVNARYLPYAHFDHACCWVDEWSKILLLL